MEEIDFKPAVAAIFASKAWQTKGFRLAYKPLFYRDDKVTDGLQNVHTPFILCREILAKLAEHADLKKIRIAVLFNLEFVDVLRQEMGIPARNITFFADSQLKALAAEKWYKVQMAGQIRMANEQEIKRNKNGKIIMPEVKRHFDCVVMNPPYKGNLHADFLRLAINLADRVVSVQPINWLLVDEDEEAAAVLLAAKQAVAPYRKVVRIINGNEVFGTWSFYMPCTVLMVDKKINDTSLHVENIDGTLETYTDIFKYNKFGSTPEFYSIFAKLTNFKDNLWEHVEITENGKKPVRLQKDERIQWFINISRVRGNISRVRGHSLQKGNKFYDDDFYTFAPKDLQPEQHRSKTYHFGFVAPEMAENFLLFLKQKIVRFCLALNKHGSSIRRKQLEGVPYLDFSQCWNDRTLARYFGLNNRELDFINSVIPDYYELGT